jgi:hypothetical protein
MENQSFPVTIDFNLPLDDMIRAGNYDWINFIPEETGQPGEARDGMQKVSIEFLTFHKNCEFTTMLEKIENQGFRPASLPEFLAIGAQYPQLQEKFWITSLTAVEKRQFVNFTAEMEIRDDRLIPCLTAIDGKRMLVWAPFDGKYRPGFLFACVRK